MQVLGLIGGIGSGKSTVARAFERLGAGVVDADVIGHELLYRESLQTVLRTRFGREIFAENGDVDRTRLARIVFAATPAGREALDFLQGHMHPAIAEESIRQIENFRAAGKQVVVLDAPLLLEAHWDSLVNRILFVDVPEGVRFDRVEKRGWSVGEFQAREAAQWPLEEKRAHAWECLTNDGSLEKLFLQVERIWERLNGEWEVGSGK